MATPAQKRQARHARRIRAAERRSEDLGARVDAIDARLTQVTRELGTALAELRTLLRADIAAWALIAQAKPPTEAPKKSDLDTWFAGHQTD